MAKVRVYELAMELGVESKAVMAQLQEMGEFVRSASSTLEAPVVRRLKEAFGAENPHPETDEAQPEAGDSQAEPWLPLMMRLEGTPNQRALQAGVPAALEQPLRDWIYRSARSVGDNAVRRAFLRLDLVGPDAGPDIKDVEEARRKFLAYNTPKKGLPEIVDAILELMHLTVKENPPRAGSYGSTPPPRPAPARSPIIPWTEAAVSELRDLLADARSIYYVRNDARGLDRRANAAAIVAVSEAFQGAGSTTVDSPAAHLHAAWNAIHALEPDPAKAYSEAVKAVESAGQAIIEPNNSKATLGTMIREIYANPSQFRLAISRGRPKTLAAMMALLWSGQTSRHGSPSRAEIPEQAEMAVQLAVTLVEWFSSGKVKRIFEDTASRSVDVLPSRSETRIRQSWCDGV